MSASQAGGLLDVAARRVLDGYVFCPGDHDNIVQGFPARVIEVDPSNHWDWFGQASNFVGPDLRMFQIMWCDTRGRFPGDPGYDPRFAMQRRFDVRRSEYDD